MPRMISAFFSLSLTDPPNFSPFFSISLTFSGFLKSDSFLICGAS